MLQLVKLSKISAVISKFVQFVLLYPIPIKKQLDLSVLAFQAINGIPTIILSLVLAVYQMEDTKMDLLAPTVLL